MNKNYIIYLIWSEESPLKYIGCTTNTLNNRFNEHKAIYNLGKPYLLYNEVRKYGGWEGFHIKKIERLIHVTKYEALCKEWEYIQLYNTKSPNGLNQKRPSKTKKDFVLEHPQYNKDYLSNYRKNKIICQCCNNEYYKNNIHNHNKSKGHILNNIYYEWLQGFLIN